MTNPFFNMGVPGQQITGPLYGRQPTQAPPVDFKAAIGPILQAIGIDIAAGRQGAGAPVLAQQAQHAQERRRRNMTLEWMKNQPGMQKYFGAVEVGALTPGEAFKMAQSGEDLPAAVQEYEYARRGGFDGSFQDWKQLSRQSVTVNNRQIGSIPPGYRAIYDDQGNPTQMQPIPGSPAFMEAQQQQQVQENQQASKERFGSVVVQDIDRALARIKASPGTTTGVGGAVLKGVPGTEAYNTKALIETVRANAGFDRLQAMRDASPTGGALGQVTERELAFLQAAIGNMEQAQDAKQLEYNLKRVKNTYLDIIHGEGAGPPREQLGGGEATDWQEYFR